MSYEIIHTLSFVGLAVRVVVWTLLLSLTPGRVGISRVVQKKKKKAKKNKTKKQQKTKSKKTKKNKNAPPQINKKNKTNQTKNPKPNNELRVKGRNRWTRILNCKTKEGKVGTFLVFYECSCLSRELNENPTQLSNKLTHLIIVSTASCLRSWLHTAPSDYSGPTS